MLFQNRALATLLLASMDFRWHVPAWTLPAIMFFHDRFEFLPRPYLSELRTDLFVVGMRL